MLKCMLCQEIFEHEGGEGAPCPRCSGTKTVPLPEPPPTSVTVRFAGPGMTPAGVGQILRGVRSD